MFERLAARDAAARAAGIMLLPGTGFDVVPTDCLAAHLKRRLPAASHLALAFQARGGASRGTLATMVENLGSPGAVRRDGRIEPVPQGWRTRRIDFGEGVLRDATTIPWGDVATAFHSTGIPNIEVYLAMPPAMRRMLVASRALGPLLRAPYVRAILREYVRTGAAGPGAEARARGESLVWGEVTAPSGERATSRLRAPNGYDFTASSAVLLARKALDGNTPAGFQTPSRAYGPDVVLEVPGVTRTDVSS